MMNYPKILLKKGKEAILRSRHPWVFSGAIDQEKTTALRPGAALLCDSGGVPLAVGTYNPLSSLVFRIFDFTARALDRDFFAGRFLKALKLREQVLPEDTNGYRLINSEGDGLPGLVVDHFAGHLVIQVGTPGLAALESVWLPALLDVSKPHSAYLRANQTAANRERFEVGNRQLDGATPELISFAEAGVRFCADVRTGQKTGFFFDQRENRRLVGALARGKRVLDCYAYTGGFSAHALAGGAASIVAVDSSEPALKLALQNAALNRNDAPIEIHATDCVEFLLRDQREYDIVIVDPPALAKRRQHLRRAAELYEMIFASGLKRVAPHGLLLACSCSAAVDREEFDRLLSAAAAQAEKDVAVLFRGGAGPDHPLALQHREGEYLKVALLSIRK